MPVLSEPVTSLRTSFLEAMAEFADEGRGSKHGNSMIDSELREHRDTWSTDEGFARYVTALGADALEETPRPTGWVPCTTWWWVDHERWLGRIALRHRLTPHLLEIGGHIGYDVRASARGHGHAKAMVRAVLPHAHRLGIDEVLLTCDVTNDASRRVIEASGGHLEDQRSGKLRFWVPTTPDTDERVTGTM